MEMEYIDFRSDTVTVPTREMLDTMCCARVGDDVYGDDPTVKALEQKSAALLGKEDAVFVPTGTFGNQLCILTHTLRGDEVLIPADNHIVLYEVGASAVIAGVQLRFIDDNNGIINLDDLKRLYRTQDIHHPRTGLICMENAHTNGTVVPLNNMSAVYEFARGNGIGIHLDGARIFNAAIALKIKPSEIAGYSDSVMFCFSKGLCAPLGSVVAGDSEFIKDARKNRKMMGGGMRQVGYIAAPCIFALENMINRLSDDHENARYLAKRLKEIPLFYVLEDRLDINMVFFKIKKENFKDNYPGSGKIEYEPKDSNFNQENFLRYLLKNRIKINPVHGGEFRFVTHYYITREKIDFTIDVIKDFISKEVE